LLPSVTILHHTPATTDSYSLSLHDALPIFKVSQPSISQHLRKLRDVGLIEEERKGQWIFYSINKANEYYPFVESVLKQLDNIHSDRKSTRLNSSHVSISYAVFCLKKKKML